MTDIIAQNNLRRDLVAEIDAIANNRINNNINDDSNKVNGISNDLLIEFEKFKNFLDRVIITDIKNIKRKNILNKGDTENKKKAHKNLELISEAAKELKTILEEKNKLPKNKLLVGFKTLALTTLLNNENHTSYSEKGLFFTAVEYNLIKKNDRERYLRNISLFSENINNSLNQNELIEELINENKNLAIENQKLRMQNTFLKEKILHPEIENIVENELKEEIIKKMDDSQLEDELQDFNDFIQDNNIEIKEENTFRLIVRGLTKSVVANLLKCKENITETLNLGRIEIVKDLFTDPVTFDPINKPVRFIYEDQNGNEKKSHQYFEEATAKLLQKNASNKNVPFIDPLTNRVVKEIKPSHRGKNFVDIFKFNDADNEINNYGKGL